MPKYALLFIDTESHTQPTPEEMAVYAKIEGWFEDLGRRGVIVSSEELKGSHDAKTWPAKSVVEGRPVAGHE